MIRKRPKTPREVAAFTLFNMREDGAWSDGELAKLIKKAELSPRDAGLASRIVYGTIQNRYMCDFYISHYSKIRLKKINPRVLDVMEMAVYQMVFMDKIPQNAAVNESIELIKAYGHANEQTVGFANGVLRSIAGNELPVLNCKDKEEYYSKRYSHPEWFVRMMSQQIGLKETEKFLQSNNEIVPLVLRVNTLKTTVADVISKLGDITVERHPTVDNILLCVGAGNITALDIFQDGLVTVQDAASATAIDVMAPLEDSIVIDCCAAPGGKSFLIAEKMKNTGKVISCDIYEQKLEKIAEGAQRLGLTNIETRLQDGSENAEELNESADFVLCDVPCSGLGIIRKKPEIRYKKEEDLKNLPDIQLKILKNCSKYLKRGGTLIYSTCTVLDRENCDVVNKFLEENSDFVIESFENKLCGKVAGGMITLLPNIHNTDGFFIAKLKRI